MFTLAFVGFVAAAPQSTQQRQIVPGPAPVNGEQRAVGANPEQAKDLESAGSIGYGYYGGYPYSGYSSSYYGGYPSYGGYGGYGSFGGYGGYGGLFSKVLYKRMLLKYFSFFLNQVIHTIPIVSVACTEDIGTKRIFIHFLLLCQS